MNQVIWSLMKLIEAAGVSAATFDPDTPATYNRVLTAIQTLIGAEATARAAADALLLPKAGGTMTGALALVGNAVSDLQAVPLRQLNAALAGTAAATAAVFAGGSVAVSGSWVDVVTTGAVSIAGASHLVFSYSADTNPGFTTGDTTVAVPMQFRIRRDDGAIASGPSGGTAGLSAAGLVSIAYAAGHSYKLQAQFVGGYGDASAGAIGAAMVLVTPTSN
jgi:hypothetical protein